MNVWNRYIIGFIILTVMASTSVFADGNLAVWVQGEVTRTTWTENNYNMVEVNGVTYRILPDIRVTYRYLRNKGAYNEKSSSVNSIYLGQKITMKVRRLDVIQIILF